MNAFLNWSEKNPYGLLIAILMIQANLIIPVATMLILSSGASEILLGPTVILSFGILVLNIALQPPRLVAKVFVANLAYHLVLIAWLGLSML